MREYQKRVNKLIQSLVSDILDGKLTNKKAINRRLAQLSNHLRKPLEELKLRIKEEMYQLSGNSSNELVKMLMEYNQGSVIKSMTADDLSILVNELMKSTLSFRRIKKGGKIVYYSVNVDEWFDYLGDDIVKKVKQGILGAYIDGSSPVEIARNVLRNTDLNSKGNRQKIKTLSQTLLHKATERANLEIMILNEKYIEWIKYQTVADARVDDVCFRAEMESIQEKLSPSEYKHMKRPIPSLHPNCRCTLYAMTTSEDNTADAIVSAITRRGKPPKKKKPNA